MLMEALHIIGPQGPALSSVARLASATVAFKGLLLEDSESTA